MQRIALTHLKIRTCINSPFVQYIAPMKILAKFARSLLGTKDAGLSQSKLVGLYLNQANGKDGAASEFHQTRQRRNGKHSHNRERA